MPWVEVPLFGPERAARPRTSPLPLPELAPLTRPTPMELPLPVLVLFTPLRTARPIALPRPGVGSVGEADAQALRGVAAVGAAHRGAETQQSTVSGPLP